MIVGIVVVVGAGILASGGFFNGQPDLSGLHGTRLAEPRALQPFTLTDHTGKTFGTEQLTGKWSFVFFGYAHCPDVCPTTLSILNSVAKQLDNTAPATRYILVGIDPGRDTPEQLGQFVTSFNSDFIGVSGTGRELAKLTEQLGIFHKPVTNGKQAGNYTVDHTASILLFDPDGRLHALFSAPLDASRISDDFKRLAKAYQ